MTSLYVIHPHPRSPWRFSHFYISSQASTKIPVMGHSEGICHVYIDKEADPVKASEIPVDAKVRAQDGNTARFVVFYISYTKLKTNP